MRRVWILASVIGFAACGGGGNDPAQCRRQAAELATLLSTMDHEPSLFRADDAKLVVREGLSTAGLSFGTIVVVTPTAVSMSGRRVDLGGLAEELAAAHRQVVENAERYGRKDMQDTTLVYLVVDEAALWGRVGAVAAAAHEAGFTRPAFVFARPTAPVTKPPRSWIDADLDRLMESEEAGNRATELARMTEKVVKTCPAMVRAFGSVASDDGGSKAETIIRAIEPSLIECNCKLDLPAFRSIMFRLLYTPQPTGSLRVTLDPARAPLAVASDTPWRVASAQLTADATVWIAPPP